MSLWEIAKSEFERCQTDRHHPFKTFCLGSQGEYPELRTVVLRGIAADWAFRFYTDARSPKVGQLLAQPKVSAMFYHRERGLQVRIRGIAQALKEGSAEFAQALQDAQSGPSLKDYQSQAAPGSILDESQSPFGEKLHFAAFDIQALEMDLLLLGDPHQRSLVSKSVKGNWIETALVP